MSIAIVTDSTADIPDHLIERFHIQVVPNTIIIDGQSYEDGKGISRQEFYQRLPTMKSFPTTASASSGAYQETYENLLTQGYTYILSIHASSLLSGIFNAASVAAQSFDGKVDVIDSGQVTLGLGFQVLEAAQAVEDKSDSPAHVMSLLEDMRQRVHLNAMLDTLEYIRRSGRVSWMRARLGEMLQIKPLIELREGKIFSLGEARTYRKGVTRLVELLRSLGPLERLAILHTNAEEEAQQVLVEFAPQVPTQPFVVNVTTVIGAHVGPCGLGFVAVTKS